MTRRGVTHCKHRGSEGARNGRVWAISHCALGTVGPTSKLAGGFVRHAQPLAITQESGTRFGRKPQNAGNGRWNLIGAVRDVNCGYGAGADEGVHGADEEGTVGGIKALAGLV